MFNKKLLITLGILLTLITIFGVYMLSITAGRESTTTILPLMTTKLVKIDGMTCESCEKALAASAAKIKGVQSIVASAKDGNAVVKYDLIKTDIETVMKEIRKTGYRPVSYKEYDAKVSQKSKSTKELNTTMKCGAGKCGATH